MAAVPALLTMIGTRINILNDRLIRLLFRHSAIQNNLYQYLRLLAEHNIDPHLAEWAVLARMEQEQGLMMEHLQALAWELDQLRAWYEEQTAMEAMRQAEFLNILLDLGNR